MRWVLALLIAALTGLWALNLLVGGGSRPRVLAPEEIRDPLSPSPWVLWENPSGRLTLWRIPPGESWRSNPASHEAVLALRGQGHATFPQGDLRLDAEELLILFQGTQAEIRPSGDRTLLLLVFSTPPPSVTRDEPPISGGLFPLRIALDVRFTQPLRSLKAGTDVEAEAGEGESIEGSPVFESPTGSVWLLRLRGTGSLRPAEGDVALYVMRGGLRLGTNRFGSEVTVEPGGLTLLSAARPIRLRAAASEVWLVGFWSPPAPLE